MKYRVRYRVAGYTLSLLLAAGGVAHADIGIPMLFVTLPAMIVSLIPIILMEAFVLSRRLGRTFRNVLGPVASANTISTLVGIPLVWFVLVGLEIVTGGGSDHGIATMRQKFLAVTWQAPWLIPYDSKELHWMVPTAMLVLLIPFFFASWFSEYQVVKRSLIDVELSQIRRGMFVANLASYALLALWVVGMLLTGAW